MAGEGSSWAAATLGGCKGMPPTRAHSRPQKRDGIPARARWRLSCSGPRDPASSPHSPMNAEPGAGRRREGKTGALQTRAGREQEGRKEARPRAWAVVGGVWGGLIENEACHWLSQEAGLGTEPRRLGDQRDPWCFVGITKINSVGPWSGGGRSGDLRLEN